MKTYYFDWTATTPVSSEALDEYVTVSKEFIGNPSSLHELGTDAGRKLAEQRNRVAEILGTVPEFVKFTSGGTESDSIVISSLLNNVSPGEIICTSIEHSAVSGFRRILEQNGWKYTALKCPKGYIDTDSLKNTLNPKVRMVCIMAVNNVCGSVLNLSEAVEIIRKFEKTSGRKIHIHCDAVQALGKIPFKPELLDLDSAAFSSHKFHGPRGVGILYNRNNNILSLSKGGGQETGLRPGTENLPGICACTTALDSAVTNLDKNYEYVSALSSKFVSMIEGSGITILSDLSAPHSPYILLTCVAPVPSEVFLRVMNDKGFCLSAGSACSANTRGKAESVLTSMDIEPKSRMSAIRVSFDPENSEEDVSALANAFITSYKELCYGKQ